MPKHRLPEAAFPTEAPIRLLFARKIRNALLVNACGFSGSKSKGKCVVPSHDAHCIDPGGRCGCDGGVVDIFCAVGSQMEYTSAPSCFIGACPKTCTEEADCGKTGLVCRRGVCVKQ